MAVFDGTMQLILKSIIVRKMNMNRVKSIVLAGLAVLVAVAYVGPVQSVSAVSSASLSIVPKKNYVIESGKSVKDKLIIRNLDNKATLDLTLRVVDFTSSGDGGTPKLMLAEDAPQTTWSLKPFLSIPKKVSIAPRASKSVDMQVTVPPQYKGGSYYSAIVYSSGSPDEGNVGLSASGVTLVFVNIPGKVKEDLRLENFGAYKEAQGGREGSYSYVTMDSPKVIAYTLKNNGNVVEGPTGSITLKDVFGREQIIQDVNPNNSLALIGQTRTFTSCIKLKSEEVNFNGAKSKSTTCGESNLWPGLYTARLDVYYGYNGNETEQLVGSASFWYLPLWFIILSLVILAVIGYVIWRIVRSVRAKFYGPRGKKTSQRRRR